MLSIMRTGLVGEVRRISSSSLDALSGTVWISLASLIPTFTRLFGLIDLSRFCLKHSEFGLAVGAVKTSFSSSLFETARGSSISIRSDLRSLVNLLGERLGSEVEDSGGVGRGRFVLDGKGAIKLSFSSSSLETAHSSSICVRGDLGSLMTLLGERLGSEVKDGGGVGKCRFILHGSSPRL